MKKVIAAFAFITFLVPPISAHAETMTFAVREQIEKITEPSLLQKEDHKKTLTLFSRAFSYKAGKMEEIFNFDSDTYYSIDHAKKEITSIPLHAFPAYAQQEKKSRVGSLETMARLIKTGTLKEKEIPKFSPIDLELELGSPNKSPFNQRIQATKDGAKHVFLFEGKTINNYTGGKDEIPVGLTDSYERFLLYRVPAQAVVRAALMKEGKAFSELTYAYSSLTPLRTAGIITLSGATVDAANNDQAPALPTDYKTVYAADPTLDSLIRELKSCAVKKPEIAAYKSKMESLIAEKKYMDAAFILFEATVIFPTDDIAVMNDTIRNLYDHKMEAPALATMTQAARSNAKNEKELHIAESTLTSVMAQYPNASILNLFLANHIKSIYGPANNLSAEQNQKLERTPAMILQALKASPWMPNAWIDLGDAYYMEFDAFTAMRCWMTARELDPHASMVARTTQFKEALEKNLPEYF